MCVHIWKKVQRLSLRGVPCSNIFGSGEALRTLTIPTRAEIGEGDDIVHAAMKIVDDV